MRQREIRTRMALGASRLRVVRQLFTEALLLALFGGLAALVLSALFNRCLQLLWGETPTESLVPAWPIAGATASIALLAAVIFGLLPAFRVTGPSPHAGRSRSVFLAAQAAASYMLLMLSGLLVHGAIRRIAADPGFDYQHVLWIAPNLQSHGLRGASAAYMAVLKDRLREIPQVRSVSIALSPPLSRDGGPHINRVDSDYLQTLGVGLVRGRMFLAGEAGVAVVSPEVAAWFWHGEDPLGRRIPVENAIVVGVTASAPSSDPTPGRSQMDVYLQIS
jgi:putative ABC transport system permease protein